MVRFTDAIFEDGVLKPLEPLALREHQRVRLVVSDAEETVGRSTVNPDREAARRNLIESFEKHSFRSVGPYPKREDLYDRKALR